MLDVGAITAQPRVSVQKLLSGQRRHARAHVVPQVPEQCQGCVWVRTDSGTAMCPFARCVRLEGWAVTASGSQP